MMGKVGKRVTTAAKVLAQSRLALGMLIGSSAVALAAGLYTNGMPQIVAATVNSVLQSAPLGIYTQLAPAGLLPVDTQLANGQSPQTVAASAFNVAGTLLDGLLNTQTSTVHAATSNTLGGVIVTESLSTAAGSTYTFTLTNNKITATTQAISSVAIYSGTNTGGTTPLPAGNPYQYSANMTLTSSTSANGSVVWVWTNNGTTALNGTMYIAWHL